MIVIGGDSFNDHPFGTDFNEGELMQYGHFMSQLVVGSSSTVAGILSVSPMKIRANCSLNGFCKSFPVKSNSANLEV